MAFPLTRLARYELRRFRGPLPKIALIFVMCVPLLYAVIYLSANWDPYGQLDRLPVAVVNEDQPVTFRGDRVAAGDDFVEQLDQQHTFDFRQVNAATAEHGLQQGDYYLSITVPRDFSANLVSGAGPDPTRAGIMLRRNDANGFVIGTITSKAQDSISNAVNASAEAAYFQAVFANLDTIRDQTVQARDGAHKLSKRVDDAKTGADKIKKGAADAAAGAKKLSTGADALSTGLGTATTGASSLSKGLDTMDSSSATLAKGADQVAAGTQKLDDKVLPPLRAVRAALPTIDKHASTVTTGIADITAAVSGKTDSVASNIDSAQTAIAAIEKEHPELAHDPQWQQLKNRIGAASDRADSVDSHAQDVATAASAIATKVTTGGDLSTKLATAEKNLTDLNSGAHQVATGAHQLHNGIHTAATGASSLSSGISDAASGADKLATGARALHTGLVTLHQGANDLDSGLAKLSDGAHKLHDGLAAGVKRLPTLTSDQVDHAVQVLSQPTDVQMTVENPATFYGRGLAPMFFAIALWVFGISVFLVVRPISGRALAGRATAARLAITGWLPVGTIAACGSLIMIAPVWAILGLDPIHPWLFLLTTLLGATCFSVIAHLLRTALGTPGSSILLVWLIVQLVSAGGLYPAPLLPELFAAIGPYMPMTYLIDAFRVVVSGGLTGHLVRDLIVLAATAVVAMAITVLVVARRKQLSMHDLHPPLVSP